MGRETNNHSIRALEKRIEEDRGDVTKLKRARNSLLHISIRVPPEILGEIFAWCLAGRRVVRFTLGASKGYRRAPTTSSSFATSGSRSHHASPNFGVPGETRSRIGENATTVPEPLPLDLVLDRYKCEPDALFDESLQDAVRSHVMKDTIRQVHLMTYHSYTLTSIISSLTPNDEGGQNEGIESIV